MVFSVSTTETIFAASDISDYDYKYPPVYTAMAAFVLWLSLSIAMLLQSRLEIHCYVQLANEMGYVLLTVRAVILNVDKFHNDAPWSSRRPNT